MMRPGRPVFRLVALEKTSRWGTKFTFLVNSQEAAFSEVVSVRVECRQRPEVPDGAYAYVVDARGPRSARGQVEPHACRLAIWLAVGHGAVPA